MLSFTVFYISHNAIAAQSRVQIVTIDFGVEDSYISLFNIRYPATYFTSLLKLVMSIHLLESDA